MAPGPALLQPGRRHGEHLDAAADAGAHRGPPRGRRIAPVGPAVHTLCRGGEPPRLRARSRHRRVGPSRARLGPGARRLHRLLRPGPARGAPDSTAAHLAPVLHAVGRRRGILRTWRRLLTTLSGNRPDRRRPLGLRVVPGRLARVDRAGWGGDAVTRPTQLPDLLRDRAAHEPDRTAIAVDRGAALTYDAWERHSNAAARGLLARGVQPGDRVGLYFDNTDWTDFAVAYLAPTKAAAIAVPLPSRFPV